MAGTGGSLHLGGPLGALGLGCLGGALALAIAALGNDPPPGDLVPALAPVLSVDIQSPVQPAGAYADSLRDNPDVSSGGLSPAVEMAQVQTAQAAPLQLPARAEGTEVQFIVRLRGAPETDVITRNFKRDPAAAQAAWGELVTRLPGLSDFSLAGASYSGEIRLAYQMPAGTPATPEEIRAVQERLLKVEGVSYADPDYIAHPGKD